MKTSRNTQQTHNDSSGGALMLANPSEALWRLRSGCTPAELVRVLPVTSFRPDGLIDLTPAAQA